MSGTGRRWLRLLGVQDEGADPAARGAAAPAGDQDAAAAAAAAATASGEEPRAASSADGSDEFEEETGSGSDDEDEEEEEEDDDDDEGSEGEEEDGDLLEANGPLWFIHGSHLGRAQRAQLFAGCRRLSDVAPEPLAADAQPIVMDIRASTAGAAPRDARLVGRGCVPRGEKRARVSRQQEQQQQQQQPQQQQQQSPGILTRSRAAATQQAAPSAAAAAALAAARARAEGQQARERDRHAAATASASGAGGLVNTARLLAAREYGLSGPLPGFARAQQRHMACERHLPVHPRKIRDKMDSRAYIGQYSPDGRFFIAAFQDKRVRLYDTAPPATTAAASSSYGDPDARASRDGGGSFGGLSGSFGSGSYGGSYSGSYTRSYSGGGGQERAAAAAAAAPAAPRRGPPSAHALGGWRLRKDVTTRMTRWTITDTTLSPDNRFLVYTTIAPVAYMVHVGGPLDVVESLANVTEVHEALNFVPRRESAGGGAGDDEDSHWGSFGIWSVAWSPGGGELIAGTNDRSVNVYDFEVKRTVARLVGHADDVNAVCYVDDSSPNIIASGSDDSTIKVWDRRLANTTCRRPVGVLLGHTEGLTHLSPRGDGRYLLSNSKDQTARLWDVRAMRSPQAVRDLPHAAFPRQPFDYRWQGYPATGFEVKHPYDSSVQVYRGHKVLQTLIRAYFSPAHSTGQRYVYSGSSCGGVFIWDLVTARLVAELRHHRAIVRDCSWHPHDPELASVSWDGTVVQWDAAAPGAGPADQAEAALRREAASHGDRFDGYY